MGTAYDAPLVSRETVACDTCDMLRHGSENDIGAHATWATPGRQGVTRGQAWDKSCRTTLAMHRPSTSRLEA
jgi:hypothetical protein